MDNPHLKVISPAPMQLGECPLWHPQEAVLYWMDIDGCAVHRLDPENGNHHCWPMPSEPGCIAWCSTGGLLIALRTGMAFLDTCTGVLTHSLPPPYDPAKLRFNDGRCDAHGRFWLGTIYEPRDHPGGSLYCVDRNGIRDVKVPTTVSNGVAFSKDNRTLYHSDTTAHRITTYDFDLESGELGTARVFKQFDTSRAAADYGGRPDGAAVDSENGYWCAMFEGARIIRFSSDGEILEQIPLPVRCPTMIAFGGPEMRTLYITSARHNRSSEELDRYPLSGHVLSLEMDVAGIPEHGFVRGAW